MARGHGQCELEHSARHQSGLCRLVTRGDNTGPSGVSARLGLGPVVGLDIDRPVVVVAVVATPATHHWPVQAGDAAVMVVVAALGHLVVAVRN